MLFSLIVGKVEGVDADGVGRGDLENERVRAEYERGYQILLDFYHQHM